MALNKYVKKGLKITAWTIGIILALFLLLVILIQVPYFQNIAKDKAVTYLEGKIHTKVVLNRIEIGLPKKVILEGFYFEDQQKDTLLYGKKLVADISLFKLLSNEFEINSVSLEGATAHISRNERSEFNFDYIIKAFASQDKKEDTSPPMKFSLRKVNLDRIKIKFDDAITKNDLNFTLNHFDTKITKFDLDNLDFEAPKITLDGFSAILKQGIAHEIVEKTSKAAGKAVKKPDLKLKLGEIDFSNIKIGYASQGTKLDFDTNLKKLSVKVNSIDLKNQSIDIEKITLNNTTAAIKLGKINAAKTAKTASSENPAGWKIKLGRTDFKSLAFKFTDENAPRAKKGIDYKNLDLANLNLEAEKLYYSTETISGKIALFTVKDRSGVDIQSLKTDFSYTDKGASLKNLYLKTPNTLLRDKIIVGYPSLASLSENIGEMSVDANLSGSRIGFKDVLLFAPNLENINPFKSNPEAIMAINSRVYGKVKDLQIPNLEISGIGNTKIAASGRVTGLPDTKNLYLELFLKDFHATAKDIAALVPPGTIPNTIQLPEMFTVKGKFKGKTDNFNADLNLWSSYGNAKVKGMFDSRVKNREKYNADVATDNFDLGKLIKNDSIGKISVRAKIKGTGLNPKTANATVDGTILKADFNHYTYRDLALKGAIRNGEFNATANMKDPNLTFDLITDGSFKGKYPAVKLKLNVDIADLEKLNLHAGPLKLRGKIDADIPTADPDYLNGKISAYNVSMANATEQFALDSIHIVSVATPDKNTITVDSQFLDAEIDGKYKLTQLGTALKNSIAKYYDANPSVKKTKTDPQQLAFKINLKSDPVLMKILPELKSLEPVSITGRYNSVNDTIVLNGMIPKVIYGSNTISNAAVKVSTEDNSLVYSVVVDDIQNASFHLPYTNIKGTVRDNILAYNLQLKDIKDKDQYLVSGTLEASEGNSIVKLLPEPLMLNYEKWNLPADNRVTLAKEGINVNNFNLENNGSALKIQSQNSAPDAPIAVSFSDFKIETITSIVKKDKLAVSGNINGEALLKNLNKQATFTSDLNIERFTFQKDTLGNINIKVDNETANTLRANVAVSGQDNDVKLEGTYRTDNGAMDMNLAINKLNLKSVQGFTMGNLSESTGFLSGDFKIGGTVKDPKVLGELQFNDIGFRVTELNSKFKDINDRILVNENGIRLSQFIIHDDKNNELVLNGKILTTNFRDYGFDLRINADNFRAVNSTAKDNDLYYGELYLDSRLVVTGDINKPNVEGDIRINKGTKFTIVLPQSDPSIEDREGIVEFIDRDNPELLKNMIAKDSISETKFKGVNANINIEIDKEAELSMIIDKGNGDYLRLKGEARLNGGIDPSGKTTLTGRYEFTEGTYEMTFNLLKRKFDIKAGSYILWTGEPTSADVNVTAVYKTDAAPIDLLDDQLGDISPEVRNTYKQKIPFETELKMKGELLKPDITFDIVLPEGNNNVSTEIINNTQTKLAQLRTQPSELNKQVFALLLLGRFIGENPFASESGGADATSIARQSASKILSQQLNDLAADLISGVELNFDLDSTEDYTTGQRESKTDLNVGVSKRLLNDRLKVTVGSSFGLEGPQQANQETNNIAGDISVDYQLTKDGRYLVRAYRKNQYQVAIQGQVVETGVAFVITMSYNKFRELFHRSQEEKEKAERREREKALEKQKKLEREKARKESEKDEK